MNSMVSSNQRAVAHINSAKVVAIFKAIAPRSFEKTFEGIATEQINHAMKLCLDGLTHEQVDKGLCMVRDNGFCPDPAMFRKWCLGVEGFGSEQQRAIDSYKKKHAALMNIIKWRENRDTVITNAEKEAYDRCYEGFVNLEYTNNYERASYNVYEAFKENYMDVVNELVEKGVPQSVWIKPVEIARKVEPITQWCEPEPEKTPEQKAQMQEYISQLKALLKRPEGEDGGAA